MYSRGQASHSVPTLGKNADKHKSDGWWEAMGITEERNPQSFVEEKDFNYDGLEFGECTNTAKMPAETKWCYITWARGRIENGGRVLWINHVGPFGSQKTTGKLRKINK